MFWQPRALLLRVNQLPITKSFSRANQVSGWDLLNNLIIATFLVLLAIILVSPIAFQANNARRAEALSVAHHVLSLLIVIETVTVQFTRVWSYACGLLSGAIITQLMAIQAGLQMTSY
jgi:hypothetical protein